MKLNNIRALALSSLLLSTSAVYASDGASSLIFSDPSMSAETVSTEFSGEQNIAHKIGSGVETSASNGADTRVLTDQEIAAINALPSLGVDKEGNSVAESILNHDARLQLNTTSYPASATGILINSAGRCTGWLINANTVITAGHCVHRGNGGGFYSGFAFYPGYTGTAAPYGACAGRWVATTSGWGNSGNFDYDYGAVKLNCTVGNSTGSFGLTTGGAELEQPVVINGYPGDKALTQWASADKVRAVTDRRFSYRNDTTGGMSGSPVWYDRDDYWPFAVNGIHTLGGTSTNSATRVTGEVFNAIINWSNQS